VCDWAGGVIGVAGVAFRKEKHSQATPSDMCISSCLWSISCSIAFSRASNAWRICFTSESLTAADSSWSSWALRGLWVQRNVVSIENEMGREDRASLPLRLRHQLLRKRGGTRRKRLHWAVESHG